MSEDPNLDRGPQLRLGHADTTPAIGFGGIAVRPELVEAEVATAIPDIGQELEEEAIRRSIAQARGERVEILAKPLPSNANLVGQMAILTAIVVVLLALPAFLLHRMWLFAFFLPLAAYFGTGWVSLLRFNSRPPRPALTLTIEGIELYAFPHDIGLIRWSEIREIRAHTCINRYLGIVPADTRSLCRRLSTEHSWLIRANSILERFIYRPFRRFMAPINLAQISFPVSADAIVAQIETFRRDNNV